VYHQAVFGQGVEFQDREAKIDVYNRHITDVQDFFHDKPDQLLLINVTEEGAFASFCDFLGIRSVHRDFPWANRSPVTPSN
jgi:hypothetical protein